MSREDFFVRSREPLLAIALALSIALASCCTPRAATGDGRTDNRKTSDSLAVDSIVEAPPRPGYCRIIGTIVEINPAHISADSSDPCSNAPCRARVKIEEILGVGDDFPPLLLSQGDAVVMTFTTSLAPINDTFNGLHTSYPGLTLHSRFRADVAYNLVYSSESATEDGSLTVYGYQVVP